MILSRPKHHFKYGILYPNMHNWMKVKDLSYNRYASVTIATLKMQSLPYIFWLAHYVAAASNSICAFLKYNCSDDFSVYSNGKDILSVKWYWMCWIPKLTYELTYPLQQKCMLSIFTEDNMRQHTFFDRKGVPWYQWQRASGTEVIQTFWTEIKQWQNQYKIYQSCKFNYIQSEMWQLRKWHQYDMIIPNNNNKNIHSAKHMVQLKVILQWW
jgi:hypothetical protein